MTATTVAPVGFQREWEEIGDELRSALERVLSRTQYILGPEVAAFEAAFAQYHGTPGAVGVGSGTDALMLALAAMKLGPGDEVITTTLTSGATITAIVRAGATPVLVDVEPSTLNIDPLQVEAAIGPRTRVILPVHLYGRPAAMSAIAKVARERGLLVVEDCAQAVGALSNEGRVGAVGNLGCFSFYPTKNLGAYGDGGMVVGSDPILVDRVRHLRTYGWEHRDYSTEVGFNSRLDEMQAALLAVKLRHLETWNRRRSEIAERYGAGLKGVTGVTAPEFVAGHVWHLYVVRVRHRDAVRSRLAERGIGTGIHYPFPAHTQPAFAEFGRGHEFPHAEAACDEILSLPMYPQLRNDEIDQVIDALTKAVAA